MTGTGDAPTAPEMSDAIPNPVAQPKVAPRVQNIIFTLRVEIARASGLRTAFFLFPDHIFMVQCIIHHSTLLPCNDLYAA
jgi:hypothetical protein